MSLNTPSALITGASSGIGAAFARRLAARGYHLVLAARRLERLEALGAELGETYGVQVEALPADLATPDGVEQVAARLVGLDNLALLVNNAGFGTPGSFARLPPQSTEAMIDVHVVASVRLAQAALPGMLARQRGGIVNVASVAGFVPLPGSVTYSATKAFLVMFSEALDLEVGRRGVRVQALCPGFTHTEFHSGPEYDGFRRSGLPGFMWTSADFVVETSLRALEHGPVVVIPGYTNRLIAWMAINPFLRPLVKKAVELLFYR